MNNERLKAAATPEDTKVIAATNRNGAKLETLIILMDRLCTLKENQNSSDTKHRRSSMKTTLIQMALASAALYLGIIDINKDNAIVSSIIDALTSIGALFL